MNKHQHLAGAQDGVIADFVAIDDGLAARVDIEALPEALANLADGAVADGQPLDVRTDRNRDKAGRLVGIVEEAAQAVAGRVEFTLVLRKFHHGMEKC
jgi:hypothetical protein